MNLSAKTMRGFTLIELSIVLVIIGLIVGGVLVGRDLIRSASGRAQVSQIEKYHSIVNTFRGKFNALPGDLDATTATQFSLPARGAYPGQGDGNGVIEGNSVGTAMGASGKTASTGETVVFWTDLTAAKLIDGAFYGSATYFPGTVTLDTTPSVRVFIPAAKVGERHYVYVYSAVGVNYFGLSEVFGLGGGLPYNNAALNVRQAYDMDKKIDDGMPMTGKVVARYVNASYACSNSLTMNFAAGNADGANTGWPDCNPTTAATAGSSATCYDNGNISGAPQQYSISTNNGNGTNCALSFQFQ